jgi:lysophospholipase L1-like esterase
MVAHFISRLALVSTILTFVPVISRAESVFKQGDVLTICGDSITQQGLYSVFIEDYILMCQPVGGVKTIQCGWGGTTAPQLADTMKNTALTFSPMVATTCYGMNDGSYEVMSPEIEKNYRDGLNRVIDNFKKSGTRTIIIGSPGVVDPLRFKNPHDAKVTAEMYNETLGKLGEIARDVASTHGVLFADVHTPMLEAMTKSKAALGEKFVTGGGDGVHASPNGHLAMAYAFLKAMGFDGNIGTITYDAESGKAEATDGHRVVSSKVGEVTIESTRYPYCFSHGANHPEGPTASILPFLPFNEELNRYMLVVKNLKAAKAKITWGEESKEFTAEQLAKGINLAAEFLKNPFVPAFTVVDTAVTNKQAFEVLMVKEYFGLTVPVVMPTLPAKETSFKQVDAGLRDIDAGLQDNCVKAIKPVTHTIKIEEEK